jgi:hypothetical protein
VTSARTLRQIAEGCSDAPPLAPDARPHWATARDGSKYVHVSLYPRTLNELRKYSRVFGRAVARDAEWSCVTAWLMSSPAEGALTNRYPVVQTVVLMMRDYDRYRFEYPRQDGSEAPAPALDQLSPDTRQEAMRVATETLMDWRNAGRPYLTPQRIKSAYQNLITTPAFTKKYIKE